MDLNELPREERRRIEREEEKKVGQGFEGPKNLKLWGVVALIILGLIGGGYWLFKSSPSSTNSPETVPGEAVNDDGREHVTDIAGVKYSSNPPTSGKHFPIWAKKGVYDRFISYGYFTHSLEHGYIVIYYDCSKLSTGYSLLSTVYAHDEPAEDSPDSGEFLMHMNFKPGPNISWITPETQPKEEVKLPDSFKTDSCKSLVNSLSEFTKSGLRVIVAPRQGLETLVALTAWGRIDKLDTVDKGRIDNFIKYFHNKGPEKTME